MTHKIAIIPMITPLYRFYVWDKINNLENFDFTFYFNSVNTHDNIEFIPLDILNSKFKWIENKNVYFKKEFFWQKKALNAVFKDFDAVIFTGNPRAISTWIASITARLLERKFIFGHMACMVKSLKLKCFSKNSIIPFQMAFFYMKITLSRYCNHKE